MQFEWVPWIGGGGGWGDRTAGIVSVGESGVSRTEQSRDPSLIVGNRIKFSYYSLITDLFA